MPAGSRVTRRRFGGWTPDLLAGYTLIDWLHPGYGMYQEITGASATTPVGTAGDVWGTWRSQAGGHYYVSPNTSSRPTATSVAGRLVPLFDGVGSKLFCATAAATQPTTLFVVGRKTGSTSGSQYLVDGEAQNTQVAYSSDATHLGAYAGGVVQVSADPTALFLLTLVFNGAASIVAANGSVGASAVNVGTGSATGTTLGMDGAGTNRWVGPLCELVRYSGAVSSADRGTVEAYLRNKWGTP